MSYPFATRADRNNRPLSHYEQVEKALFFISPDLPLEDWKRIGAALKDDGFDFEMFDRWSSKGASYKFKECRAWWKSFKAGGTHIATLFWYAKQNGYKTESSPVFDKAEYEKRKKEAEKRAIELQAVIKLNQAAAAKHCADSFATAPDADGNHPYLELI
jgi:putative DNA primase/helicase